MSRPLRLEAMSCAAPVGARELLDELGAGENGFMGTTVGTDGVSFEEYVRQCEEMRSHASLPPGLVPQTVYWVLDATHRVVGMVKVRHYLNDKLHMDGGHIGYYVRRGERGKGYATAALRLALDELTRLGQSRALLTVRTDNAASARVIEKNGGRLEDTVTAPDTGERLRRYWISLPVST